MDFFEHHPHSAAAKRKDYRNVFIIQAALLTFALLLADLLRLFQVGEFKVVHHSVYLLLGGAYFYLLWDLLKNFIKSRAVIAGLFFAITLMFVAVFILQNPFLTVVSNPTPGLIVVHSGLVTVEVLAIVTVFGDVFSPRSITKNNLWGAVSLFLMMTINFASIYDLLNLIAPGGFRARRTRGQPLLSGSDRAHTGTGPLRLRVPTISLSSFLYLLWCYPSYPLVGTEIGGLDTYRRSRESIEHRRLSVVTRFTRLTEAGRPLIA